LKKQRLKIRYKKDLAEYWGERNISVKSIRYEKYKIDWIYNKNLTPWRSQRGNLWGVALITLNDRF
jgi:hypothetical protein